MTTKTTTKPQRLKHIQQFKIDTDDKGNPYIVHLLCSKRSYNPNDIKYKYCGFCRKFIEKPVSLNY